MSIDFPPFPKIARYSREVIVTEKIDGTNALIQIAEDGTIWTGARNGWITPERDNFGFAQWVADNEDAIRGLGPGRHYGEWWGNGIQRAYGQDARRFSLFNAIRWQTVRPTCCDVVPILWQGPLDAMDVPQIMSDLARGGSRAAPGFDRPEGIVIFHTTGRFGLKKTFQKDDDGKGKEPTGTGF